ncbi:MAG TPA: outer membrane protein [Kaistia sp.]|nr:outer membrane protein [Kaistia sp.]
MLRIRTLSLGAACLAFGALPAAAADYSYDAPAATAFAAPVGFTWTGPYLGAIVGYTWSTFEASNGLLGGRSIDAEGGKIGGYAGYNYELGNNVVVGGEMDLNWDDVKGNTRSFGSVDQTWDSTIRARAGYSFGRVMAYGTGGAAVSGARIDTGAFSSSATHWGWTLGAGAEAAITDHVTARVEYQYADYGSQLYRTGVGTASDVDFTTGTIRAGLGYKF